MANEEHLAVLRQGPGVWNAWRGKHRGIIPDLREAQLGGANLDEAALHGADLREVNFSMASLSKANLRNTYLDEAILSGANVRWADLHWARLHGADLRGANLHGANSHGANLHGASLQAANLMSTVLVQTDLTNADITDCLICGISAWDVKLDGTIQRDLVITAVGQSKITVDNIEVGQFIYLLLHNEKIRNVIDTITSKVVLILGRFTPERKAVLDALREELRKHDYLPVLFDFDKPASKDLTGTVSTLANMARFIADLTDPSCIPYELATVLSNTFVPVQPILLSGKSEFIMFSDLRRRFHWVLTTHRYDTQERLIAELSERVIRPAEAKVRELRGLTDL